MLVTANRPNLDLATGVGAGILYGVVLWALLAVVVMPVWLGMAEMVPNVDTTSLVGHVVYGALLGVVYATLER